MQNLFLIDLVLTNPEESLSLGSLVKEGSNKMIFEDDSSDYIIIKFKDYLVDKKSNKKSKVKNKGIINAAICVSMFKYLQSYNVQSHFKKQINDDEITAKKLDMIQLEVLVRNYATGKFSRQFGFKEGDYLNSGVLEFYLKDDRLNKPQICESLIFAKEIASKEEVISIKQIACKTNAILKTFFERRNLNLIDIRLEFGRSNKQVILGDEISLDTCTFWDTNNHNNSKSFKNLSMNKIYQMLYEKIIGEN